MSIANDIIERALDVLHHDVNAGSVTLSRSQLWDLEYEMRQLRRELDHTKHLLDMANADRVRDRIRHGSEMQRAQGVIALAREALEDRGRIASFEKAAARYLGEE